MSLDIRKIVTVVDETLTEMGREVSPPIRRAAAIAVIANPFAGRYVEDLTPLIEAGEELGKLLSERAVAALGISGPDAQSYGKAALVGEDGELEHAAALLHPKMGTPFRKTLGKADLSNFPKRLGFDMRNIGMARWSACFAINVADKLARRIFGQTLIYRLAPLLKRSGV